MWNSVSYIGTKRLVRDSDKRNVILTNRITTVIFLLNWVLFFITVRSNGFSFLAMAMSIGNVSSYTLILLFNHLGYSVLSRIIVSWMVSVFTFVVTLMSKMENANLDEINYISPRVFILATSIVPLLVFNYKQIGYLCIALAGSFVPIVLFDTIHAFFGVGVDRLGVVSGSYSFIVVMIGVCYLLFVTSILFFKRITEQLELKNEGLINSLEQKNARITAQSEELKAAFSNVKNSNRNLESKITERTETILQQTHRFKQFSRLNSHDLRAPLTNIIGLLDHLKSANTDQERINLLLMLETEAQDLDQVIRKINDILNEEDESWMLKEPT